jgi:flagellar biosynthesis/type III secretory pathway protein FliH
MHELSEVRAMLSERVKEWTQQWEQQGLQRGRQEGRQEGKREGLDAERALLLRQTRRRFGALIAAQLQPLLAVVNDPESLAVIGEWLIDYNTGEALLQQVEQFVKQAPIK